MVGGLPLGASSRLSLPQVRCVRYHLFFNLIFSYISSLLTTFSDGCLGSSNDEGRRKMR
jgi:hypothetical protein